MASKNCVLTVKGSGALKGFFAFSAGNMKLAARLGIGLGLFSFLFATYTAVTGPVLLPDAAKATRERMAKIQAGVQAGEAGQAKEAGGGCCAKKTETAAGDGCAHAREQAQGCAHGTAAACPSQAK
jgi:hypothetical protein